MLKKDPSTTSASESRCRVALTGDVALEVIASYFGDAGYDVMPQDVSLDVFRPDFVYDVTSHDAVLSSEVPGFFDERMKALSGCKYSVDGIRAIVDEFSWLVRSRSAWRGVARKMLAVDADNTLWTGILSEDGADALVPCAEFQKGLARLRDDGIVLAVLSKNDRIEGTGAPVDASLFAAGRVNWAPKPGNLVEICRELRLSTDSVVFVDDNPHERAMMSSHLPDVAVAPWNGWNAAPGGDVSALEQRQLVRRLREYFFSGGALTEEDRLRSADYASERRREAERLDFATKDQYLDALGLWVEPAEAAESDLDRLAQMAGKTNQFNATTIRRSREDFAGLLAAGPQRSRVFVFRAGDKFGEQGLVCYIVVDSAARRITDFVMSCRAMGRTLEHFALGHVAQVLGFMPEIDFSPTEKNAPFAAFLATVGNGLSTHYQRAATIGPRLRSS